MFLKVIEVFKVILFGIIEGISEWLPISSSGHLLLLDNFIKLEASEKFKEMFFIFIQLGAVLAVVLIFFKKLFPFYYKDKIRVKRDVLNIWYKVIIACIPGTIVTFIFSDLIDKYLENTLVITLMLFVYGLIFILIENHNKNRNYRVNSINDLRYLDALYIGLFQILSIIPGTSRSGATIVGALLIGVNRVVTSEFTFYLAIPVMFGMSLFKLIDFGFVFTINEISLLLIGMVVSFAISLLVIKFLMNYLKNHDFKIFGIYRIILGMILISYFLFIRV